MQDQIIVLTDVMMANIVRQAAKDAVIELRDQLEPKPRPDIFTKAEVAEYLRCDISKINRFMRTGMPHFIFGSTPRFRKTEIDRWLEG